MFQLQSNSLFLQRLSCAVALALPLTLGSCEQQQAAPVAKAQQAITAEVQNYYLNGQPSTKEVIEQLNPKTIVSMNVLKGQQATDYTHDTKTQTAILIQTK